MYVKSKKQKVNENLSWKHEENNGIKAQKKDYVYLLEELWKFPFFKIWCNHIIKLSRTK